MQGNEQRALLLHLATMAEIPVSIMDWLIDNHVIESMFDLTITPLDEIVKFQGEYQFSISMNACPWTYIVSCNLRSLITWLLSFRRSFGGCPHPCVLSKENFKTQPEILRSQWHDQGINLAAVTSNCVSDSQYISQRHSNYHVLAYPSFSGYTKDWIEFERDFRAIATAQGFGYILQSGTSFSTTAFSQHNYILDSTFIYNVLKYCWSDSTSSYLVKQHASSKNGRQLYLDAQKFFRIKAMQFTPVTRVDASPCTMPISPCDRQQAIKLRLAQLRLERENKSNLSLPGTPTTALDANMPMSPVSQPSSSETFHADRTHVDHIPEHDHQLNSIDTQCPIVVPPTLRKIDSSQDPVIQYSIMVPQNAHQLMPIKVPTVSGELLSTSTATSCPSSLLPFINQTNLKEVIVPIDTTSFAPSTDLTNLGEIIMSNATSCLVSSIVLTNLGEVIVPDATPFAFEIAHDSIDTAHDSTNIALCLSNAPLAPPLTFGLAPTQCQQQKAPTWQQLHTLPETGLHFKHVLWDFRTTPSTSDIDSTIHWTRLYNNHQIMQIIDEIGETQTSPFTYHVEAAPVLPSKKDFL